MKQKEQNALFQASHMMILVTYTALFCALAAEDFLMGWEKWPLIPIILTVCFSWYAHVQQLFSDRGRLLLYVVFMMVTLFFYGIHLTSTFDLALVMCAAIILCTTTGIKFFVTLCQITYFVTFAYDIGAMLLTEPQSFDSLVISRSMLHVLLILTVGFLARIIIDRWMQVLEASKEEVEHLTDATARLNDFLTNVSHEIRTPINAVLGLSGICLERAENREQRENLRQIRAAGKRVAEQIGDILDYSEVDRKRFAMNPEDYMLSSVLHDLVMELEPYERKGVELIIDVDPAIPSVMHTDVSKLKKIIWHLTTNALKFTKEGGVYLRLTAEAHDYGINLLLSLSDTGSGMAEEEMEHLFDGFYQSNAGLTRSSGGLGLGLSIVNGFVSAMGGFLTLDSRPGEGTTVHVCLPQKVVDPTSCMSVRNPEKLEIGGFLNFEKFPDPAVREYYNNMVRDIVRGLGVRMRRVDNLENLRKLLETVRLTHLFVGLEEYETDPAYMERLAGEMTVTVIADGSFRLPKRSGAHVMRKPFYCFPVAETLNRMPGESETESYFYCRGVRALVVDDEPLNILVARDIFRRYGMEVASAASGQEAIDLCARESFDIVFMDHMMPGMDGIEAMRRIRSSGGGAWKSVPMVALTANAVSTAREAFRAAGFDGFVAKPIDLMELERVLRSVLPENRISFEDKPYYSGADREEKARREAPEDEYEPLRRLGVDIRQGLSYCAGDEAFYRTLLRQVASEAGEKRAELQRCFDESRLEEYRIHIHALKSTAKTVGANALSEQARRLEAAAGAGRAADVRAGHAGTMEAYGALAAAIAELDGDERDALADSAEEADVLEFGPDGEVSG